MRNMYVYSVCAKRILLLDRGSLSDTHQRERETVRDRPFSL